MVEIEDGFASFVEQWEGVFNAKGGALNGEVGGDRERGQFSFITTHLLLHLGAQVRIWGPPLAYSQYPIERVIGQEKNSIHHSSDIEAHVVANAARRQRTSIMLKRFPHLSISHRQQPLTNSLSHTTETSLFTLLHKRRKGLAQEGLRTAIIDCIGNGDDQDDEDDEDDDEDGLELEFFARLKSPEGEVSRSVWGETTAGRRSSAKVRKARRVWVRSLFLYLVVFIQSLTLFAAARSFRWISPPRRGVLLRLRRARRSATLPCACLAFQAGSRRHWHE